MKKYCIYRFIDGISLNGKEFIKEGADPKNPIKLFDTEAIALEWLNGASGVEQSLEEWENEGVFIGEQED